MQLWKQQEPQIKHKCPTSDRAENELIEESKVKQGKKVPRSSQSR